MPKITVICLHGLQSHPDILANAMYKLESNCNEKIVTTSASTSSSTSFVYPCASVPVQRTFNIRGESVPVEMTSTTTEDANSNHSDASSTFEKIQLYGWTPGNCVCCRSKEKVDAKNKNGAQNGGGETPCFVSIAEEGNHFRAAFDIVLNEIEMAVSYDKNNSEDQETEDSFFVLLGFSQGGVILQTLVTAIFGDGSPSSSSDLVKNLSCGGSYFKSESQHQHYKNIFVKYCAGLVFSGSPSVVTNNNNFFFSTVPSFHIIGNNDKMVLPSESLKNLELFTSTSAAFAPTLLMHEGGHPVPTTTRAIDAFFSFIQQRVLVLACQKKWFLSSNEDSDVSPQDFFKTLQDKQSEALNNLKENLTEELEVVSCALPEGSTVSCVIRDQAVANSFLAPSLAIPTAATAKNSKNNNKNNKIISSDPNPCVDVEIEMMLPGLDANEEIRQAFFASLSKKSLLKMKIKKWSNDNDDNDNNGDDDDEVGHDENNQDRKLIQNKGIVRLTIKVPLGYPTSDKPQSIPRCLLSSLPPLLAIQSHRNAQLLSAVYDTCGYLLGTPMVMNICLCVVSELEAWVSSATQQILDGNLSRTDSSEDDLLKAAVINDPWLIEMDDDERAALVTQVHKEVDEEVLALTLKQQQQGNPLKKSSSSSSSSSSALAAASPSIVQTPGEWRFVIGLVGKPSSGKSSTFNSVTDPESEAQAAKVGNFPFTTIEPNIARAWCGIPCPCQMIFGKEADTYCGAAYGHLSTCNNNLAGDSSMIRYRRHPVEIRDVAGLVRGAYKGYGKGNKFLNDLCDADVLVHIVDGGGKNSADGVELENNNNNNDNDNEANTATSAAEGASAPEHDVEWVRNEIHNWIFDNVEAKWSTIRYKPKKLLSMFTGYHANFRLTEVALERCGVKLTELDIRIPAWTPRDLHRLIAHFIRLRFPIVLAVNKCDMPGAIARAKKVQEMYPSHVVKTMSARVECELLRLRREGKITNYTSGADSFGVVDNSSTSENKKNLVELTEKEKTIQIPALKKFLAKFHSTGVQDVLAAAISLRPPLLCFPVDSELAGIAQHYAQTRIEENREKETGVFIDHRISGKQFFKDCLTLRPGTTAEAAFKTAARLGVLEGGSGSSSSASSGATSTTGGGHGSVNSSRYHEYSLVRCDVVELPMKQLWTGEAPTAGTSSSMKNGYNNGNDNNSETSNNSNNNSLKISVCRKEEVLPSVCCVRMVGKKG